MLNSEKSRARRIRRTREKRLRTTLRKMLRDAGVDHPMDMFEVCDRLSRQRDRPISVTTYPLAANGPFGLWQPGRKAEWILVQPNTTPVHQQHIIAHEVGHILCGHRPEPMRPDDTSQSGNFDCSALRRTAYDTEQEQDAETVATLLLESAAARESVLAPSSSARAQRAQHALGDLEGWL